MHSKITADSNQKLTYNKDKNDEASSSSNGKNDILHSMQNNVQPNGLILA